MTDKPQRLAGRNGDVWQAYLSGVTQEAIAERFGISQSRVSQLVTEVRASIPEPVIAEIKQAEAERIAMLYTETVAIMRAHHPVVSLQRGEVIPGLEDAGPKLAAIAMALKIHERVAKTYGTDAAQKIEASAQVKFSYEGVDVDAV
jgi:transcriptional regulator with XRE-family HTH domain